MSFASGGGEPYPLLPVTTVVDSNLNLVLDQSDIDDALVQCGQGCNLYFPAGVYLDVEVQIGSFPNELAMYGHGRVRTVLRGPIYTTGDWRETIVVGNNSPDGVIIQDLSVDGRKLDQNPSLLPTNLKIMGLAPATLLEDPRSPFPRMIPPEQPDVLASIAYGRDDKETLKRLMHGRCVMGSFEMGKGEVFNTGTTEWAHGLAAKEPLVEAITQNIMARFGMRQM